MSFEIDNQTLRDLNIFPNKKKEQSIFDLFKQTKTVGGQNTLIRLMKNPLNNFEQLSERVEAIRYFQDNNIAFHFIDRNLEFIEHYLNLNMPVLRKGWIFALSDWLSDVILPTNEYFAIKRGLKFLQQFLLQLKIYIESIQLTEYPEYFNSVINEFNLLNTSDLFKSFLALSDKKINRLKSVNSFDNLIRKKSKDDLLKLISKIYEIDSLRTVALVSKENNYCLPDYTQNNSSLLNIDNLFHPFVNEPITNSFSFNEQTNMCFLTGANMAGKSTFLKSVGLCCYLAHLGFPVPASKMETSIYSGLITAINLSDDVTKGYSHFYSEVKRVKNTAISIKEKKKILVIFDELFRGTNVKDAYDASLMITAAFAKIKHCAFFISTHIVEIAEELKNEDNIIFKYFESEVVNEIPVYSYKLANGVSADRHGLRIVKNEKIVEILEGIINE
ncbi:MAG: hypothetical protein P1P88_00130 [Bacteroidales bacterium]|nr:hypothetical protein [Bacteroidales bacterium]